MIKKIPFSILLLFVSSPLWSATLYMGAAETYTNLQSAMAAMSSGDTLIIRDGTYTGATNVIDNTHYPPYGSAGTYTTIQAEHPGSVIFDGEGARAPIYFHDLPAASRYWKFVGLVFGNSNQHAVCITTSDYVTFQRCGFYDAAGSYDALNTHTCNYWLLEDCYSWGMARYHFHYYRHNHSIMRRCVVRHDKGDYVYQVGIQVYNSTNTALQNCIVIDSDQTSYYDSPDEIHAYKFPQDNSTGLSMEGCISVGNEMNGYVASAGTIAVNNFVTWYNGGLDGIYSAGSAATTATHSTIGSSMIYGFASGGTGANYLYNSIVYDGTYGIYNWGTITSDYNAYYENTTNFQGATDGAHDYCSQNSNAIDPLWAAGNTSGGLKYLPRIESGSNLSGLASDAGDIGATILYQVGVTGTIWGETGYNTTTATDLWPFPYESIIKTAFQGWSASGQTGDRGFADSTDKQLNGTDDVTLTSYIWEYLGNEIPSDIYGSTPAPPTLSFYLTNPLGSGAAQGSPHNSLGGYRSTTQVSASAMKNLFDDVTVAESIVGDTEYRFLDVYNSGDSSATKVQVFVSSDTSSSGTEITLGYNSTNQPHEDSWDGEDVANEDTAPASPSLTFGTYTRASPLHLGTIPAGRSVRICVKRTVTAGVPWTARDVGTIAVRYLGD